MEIVINDWRVDCTTRQASRAEERRVLSPRAIRLLCDLVEARGAVRSRATLLDRIWPDVTVGDESLTQVVAEVRRKLGDKGVIETIAKGGYRLSPRQPSLAVPATCLPAHPTEASSHLEAHALCLEARCEMVRCGRGSLERAEALTDEAVQLAPQCAGVRAERSIALVRAHTYWSEGRRLLQMALAEAEQAVALQPDLAVAQSALGYAHAMFGHWTAAETAHAAAVRLDTRDPIVLHNAGWYLMSRGQTLAAIAYFEQVGDIEPQNIKGYFVAAQLSRTLDPNRSRRNAERALQRARARIEADPTDPRALSAAAALMAMLGEYYASYTAMEQIDVHGSTQAIYHASAMAQIGEKARAKHLLEELFDHGWRDVFWLNSDPSFVEFGNDRRARGLRQSLVAA
ncbi:MAG: winged helix-turn-helix domain-containing protein [Pseudomonadota bacterium]